VNRRWVVVDVESSGLDANRDRLVSIGAIGVRAGMVVLADSFETVLREEPAADGADIPIHGIGVAEQRLGEAPADALRAFLEFIGDDPLVAYHAAFDERLLARAVREHLDACFRRDWLDLARVAPLAWPGRVDARSGLDGWLEALRIPMTRRHRAIVDCLATAQLLVAVLERAPALGVKTPAQLMRLSRETRWIGQTR
jgi:DNA polymerase III subunit epsilon